MKYKMRTSLYLILICLVALCSTEFALAQNAGPEQKQKSGLYLWSRTDISSVQDEELAKVYRDADARLMDQVRSGLLSRDISVSIVGSERDIAADPTRFILIVKVEKIELGSRRPFGRTAKVKVNYTVQNKDRVDIVGRSQEETSVQKWQNCVKKISEQIVDDVSKDIAKKSVPAAGNKKDTVKQAPAGSSEARLQEIEQLKAKGLITEKEYEIKRKEILKEL